MAKKSNVSVKPLADKVLIEPVDLGGDTTSSGIIIPDTIDGGGKPLKGVVMAVGPGRVGNNNEIVPMFVKVGDIVIFKYARNEINVNNKDYYIISEPEILAVVE